MADRLLNSTDNNARPAKFYGFHCINLYGEARYNLLNYESLCSSNEHEIIELDTPLELYESPEIARLILGEDESLMVYAVYVSTGLYDELDISAKAFTNNEFHDDLAELFGDAIAKMEKANVIRNLNYYGCDHEKPYISYTVKTVKVIKNTFPISV